MKSNDKKNFNHFFNFRRNPNRLQEQERRMNGFKRFGMFLSFQDLFRIIALAIKISMICECL